MLRVSAPSPDPWIVTGGARYGTLGMCTQFGGRNRQKRKRGDRLWQCLFPLVNGGEYRAIAITAL